MPLTVYSKRVTCPTITARIFLGTGNNVEQHTAPALKGRTTSHHRKGLWFVAEVGVQWVPLILSHFGEGGEGKR